MSVERRNPLLQQPFIKGTTKVASYAVTGQDLGTAFRNTTAAGAVTFTLPAAVPGLDYRFLVTTAQTITVTPQATDTIRGKAIGASASNAVVGNLLKLVCIQPLFWEPEINIGSW